jgi:hypothetical protein
MAGSRIDLRRLTLVATALPLAGFFGFVGWHKTFDSMLDLTRYHAWTAHVPEWIGRPIGLSELAGSLALLAAAYPPYWRWTRIAALWLASTQIVSTAIHVQHQEADFVHQNSLLFAALILVAVLVRNPDVEGSGR